MSFRALRSILKVQPADLQSAVRLYLGLGIAMLAKLLMPRAFKSSGYWIPGTASLTVLLSGTIAKIRPRTTDLAVLAGSQEPATIRWLRPNPGEIVVDVGAHIGRYTLIAARRGAKVVAVEPEPSNFSVLKENIELNGFSNVIACQFALSNTTGRRSLYLGDNGQGDTATSSLDSSMMRERSGRTIERFSKQVDCLTLDNLMKSLHVSHVNWLKVDVEFHEIPVLEGGESTLRSTENLIIEVTHSNEDALLKIANKAGLRLVTVERNTGWNVDNLWLKRS